MLRILSVFTMFLIFVSCKSDKVDCATFHWGYGYTNGPELWGQCEVGCKGKLQSPIDIIDASSDVSLSTLEQVYQATAIDLEHNGHAIELTYEAGSVLTWDGKAYELKQAHLHGGSEHTVNGERYELEMHLVHKHSDNDLTVIGIFIEEGVENQFFNQFFNDLPQVEGEVYTDSTTVNIANAMPSSGAYYNYSGSLTTPPCSEIVNWIVMKEPITASAEQIEKLRAILEISYRPTQKLGKRTIKLFE